MNEQNIDNSIGEQAAQFLLDEDRKFITLTKEELEALLKQTVSETRGILGEELGEIRATLALQGMIRALREEEVSETTKRVLLQVQTLVVAEGVVLGDMSAVSDALGDLDSDPEGIAA